MKETKFRYLVAPGETLKSSLEDSMPSNKELEVKVSKLKDDLVANFNTYFMCLKEKVSFFYFTL